MKRIISILLSLMLLLSFTLPAFAADTGVSHDDVVVKKGYTVTGGDGKTIPAETLTFSVSPEEGNPDSSTITVAAIDTSKTTDITIKFPSYTKMGVYKYLVTEDKGETLGVTYDEAPIRVVVTVVNETAGTDTVDTLKVYVGVYKLTKTLEVVEKIEGEKDSEEEITHNAAFTNKYDMGKLTVSKSVTGNLASNTKMFTIHVNFKNGKNAGNGISYSVAGVDATAPLNYKEDGTASIDIELKHGESATFTNIAAGVSYTVGEDSKHTSGDLNSEEGYTATYDNTDSDDTTTGKGTIAKADEDTVAITNEKSTEIQTGISLDSIPYVLMIMVVMGMVSYMVIRRRRFMED